MEKNNGNGKTAKALIFIADPKKYWLFSVITGVIFWLIALLIWNQEKIDEIILFFFNPARLTSEPIIVFSKYLSSYGMFAITTLFILYFLLSRNLSGFDAPVTINFYTICSFALGGIAGDLLKFVFSRPRPATAFGDAIFAWSDSLGFAIPSGHATKSVALILPFLFLVSGSKKINTGMKVLISLIAGGVCFSRIALGAHYLSDVLAGIGTALIGFPLSLLFARMVLRQVTQERLAKLIWVWAFLLVFLTIVFILI